MSKKNKKNKAIPTNDKLENLVTGLGTSRSKVSHTRISAPTLLTNEELQALYVDNWVFGKLVDMVAKDMVRPWRTFKSGEKEDTKLFLDNEKKFKVRQKTLALVTQARMQGSAMFVIGDGNNMEKPIDREKVSVKSLQVLSKDQLSINSMDIEEDMSSEYYGLPRFYQMSHDSTRKIHVSRTIRYDSVVMPFMTQKRYTNWWGVSNIQRVWDALLDDATVAAGLVQMASDMNLDVVSIDNLVQLTTTDQGLSNIKKRFEAHSTLKSVFKMIVLDSKEKLDRKTVSFTGTQELSETFMNRVSAASEIPLTKFYGTSAKGMNSTGEGDEDDYDEMVTNETELKLRPILEELDFILSNGKNIEFSWNPLKLPSAETIAKIEKTKIETAKIAIDAKIVSPKEIREDMLEKKWYVNVSGAAPEETEEPLEEEDEEQVD